MKNLLSFDYKNLTFFYRGSTVDEQVMSHSFDNDIFFKEIPELRNKPNGVFIDVGAHIGTFSVLAAMKFPGKSIYAIEASEESFKILRKNIACNNLNSIMPYHVALSNKVGFEKLYLSEENWANRIVGVGESNKFEVVPAITLTSLFEIFRIQFCDLLRLNCEGAEFKIILSLGPLILEKIHLMLILFHEDFAKNHSRNDLTEFLLYHGFSTRLVNVTTDRGWLIATK